MRFYLEKLFGTGVQIRLLERLLQNYITESTQSNETPKIIWKNVSEFAKSCEISKSSSKRGLETLLKNGFIEEKQYETHATNPPRYFRLNLSNNAISELIFFYKKARGFL